jgi:hypothetical protein
MNEPGCQLTDVSSLARPLGRPQVVVQRILKLRRSVKRRVRFLLAAVRAARPREADAAGRATTRLEPGDVVVVRSRKEIEATLDRWGALHHCGFMEEMAAFCGTRQRVLKRVERFLDERDYLVKTTRGIVILENVVCPGTVDFGRCDRTCFFFWREEWLVRGPEEP